MCGGRVDILRYQATKGPWSYDSGQSELMISQSLTYEESGIHCSSHDCSFCVVSMKTMGRGPFEKPENLHHRRTQIRMKMNGLHFCRLQKYNVTAIASPGTALFRLAWLLLSSEAQFVLEEPSKQAASVHLSGGLWKVGSPLGRQQRGVCQGIPRGYY